MNSHLPMLFCVCTLSLIFDAYAAPPQTADIKVVMPELAAEVNGDKIMKQELSAECLILYGQTEIQDLISKVLIENECRRQNIVVQPAEIDAEIVKTAKTFKMSSAEFLQLLEQRRHLSAEDYRINTVWRVLALSKLAGPRLTVSEQEIEQGYESKFGQAVQVRQLVLATQAEAEKTVQELRAKPETFANVVKDRSLDTASQGYGGLIQPVRRYTLPKIAENVIFAMQPGQISNPVQMFAGQWVIFKCEQIIPPQDVDRNAVKEQIVMKIRESKLRRAAEDVYRDLQKAAKIEIFQTNGNTAATVNGQTISTKELADVCVRKYGKQVLADMISRQLVMQACKQANITITDADIDNEIRDMAAKHLALKPDGTPNVELWLKHCSEESGQPFAVYRKNTIVPVLALKRLTQHSVKVTDEDVQRSYEANFGKKVKCLAISFGAQDHRRAQEVWDMANKQRTPENFGDLAEKYSIDPDTRLSRGVIPPIGKHCGAPELEKEAFALKAGELSQIIQSEENLVIMYCLGYTEASAVKLDEVKADIIADVSEKKQNLMAGLFYERLYDTASIDNYLTGESYNPKVEKAMNEQQNRQK